MTRLVPLVAILLSTLPPSCTQDAEIGHLPLVDSSDAGPTKLDLLFVVDNSASMLEEQQSMAANMQMLLNPLGSLPGGLPSLHVGVISTDLGVGPYNIAGCVPGGDGGALQALPADASCQPPTDAYISDEIASDGTRITNYTGSLQDSFACIAQIGIQGCGFEQPLEAMRVALESDDLPTECELAGGVCYDELPGCVVPVDISDGNAACGGTQALPKSCCIPDEPRTVAHNGGFLRDDARLAIVILTDEDDCSASDTEIFDPIADKDWLGSSIGPLSSFRCAEYGLQCDGGPVDRAAGTYTDCQPLGASPYIEHPDEYVTYLTSLKGDPDDVIVAVIAGDRNGLAVNVDGSGHPTVSSSCQSADGLAFPAHRLGYFAEQFDHHLVTSICDADLSGAMMATGAIIREAFEDPQGGAGAVVQPDPADEQAGCTAAPSGAGSLGSLGLLALCLLLVARARRHS